MKTKLIWIGLIAIVIVAGCVGEAKNDEKLLSQCCGECTKALSTSPLGVGPEGIKCSIFANSGTIKEHYLSKRCSEFFEANDLSAGDCLAEGK